VYECNDAVKGMVKIYATLFWEIFFVLKLRREYKYLQVQNLPLWTETYAKSITAISK
jgi:hypothetical protein